MPLLDIALLCSLLLLLLTHQVSSSTDYLPLVGQQCNPNNNRLLTDNNQLKTDCGYVAWCDINDDVCKVRGCRRDEWPFGFNIVDRDLWPPICGQGQFCPDEGSFCMNQIALGQPCQLSRDDECIQSASPGGVMCLHNVCVAVNATLGNHCTIENTIYTDFTNRNNNYGDIISRDNCMSGMYCDAPTTQCKLQLANGISCSADKECTTGYCFDNDYQANIPVNNNYTGRCGTDPSKTRSRAYVYVVIAILIVGTTSGLAVWLVKIHLKQTKVKKAAREEYWQGQKSISGKARLLDESIRSGSPYLSANPASLANFRLSSQSTTPTINSNTPLRKESKLQHPKRYSDHRSRLDFNSNTNIPYGVDINYAGQSQDNLNQEDGYVTPPQSASVLGLLDSFTSPIEGPSAATSSAVDPFTTSSDYVRSRDNARNRPENGWQSPDHRLG